MSYGELRLGTPHHGRLPPDTIGANTIFYFHCLYQQKRLRMIGNIVSAIVAPTMVNMVMVGRMTLTIACAISLPSSKNPEPKNLP